MICANDSQWLLSISLPTMRNSHFPLIATRHFITLFRHWRHSMLPGQRLRPCQSNYPLQPLSMLAWRRSRSTMTKCRYPMCTPCACVGFICAQLLLVIFIRLPLAVLDPSQKDNHLKDNWTEELYQQALRRAQNIVRARNVY